ncbi:MAG TPA: hypothetical protein VLM80_13755 [Anaerolineales bacterium]|nr:hypothetical protein [Anaerolineales bacterium]
MASIENTIFCDGCGVEITWSPVLVRNSRLGSGLLVQRPLRYCCQACSEGLPCKCTERMELEEQRRSSSISIANYE